MLCRTICSAAWTSGVDRMERGAGRQAKALWASLLGTYLALIFYLSTRPHLQAPVRWPLWDKLAHGIEYALLGFLAWRAWGAFARPGSRRALRAVILLAAGLAIGLFDEWVQSHVPGREASALDWLCDGAGFAAGIGIAGLRRRTRMGGRPRGGGGRVRHE